MSCPQCGEAMVRRRENYRYDGVGIPGVTLLNVEVSRCPSCGEAVAHIPRIELLHRSIARAVAEKPERLTAQQARFLRKRLGFSAQDFASAMDVAPATVSRWERGTQRMSVMAERLLRLMVLKHAQDYEVERLRETAVRAARPLRLGLREDKGSWLPAA